jgi:DNA (cytosine-5)-methyltransferase 1
MEDVRAATGTSGLKVASLFAGAGGSSLGYRLAGFSVAFANEFYSKAADVYELNKSAETVLDRRSINGVAFDGETKVNEPVKGSDILKAAGGSLDVLDGSPPCQDFSTAGKRDLDGARAGLYYEAIRLLGEVRPRAFAFENVTGLVKGESLTKHYRPIKQQLRDLGYRIAGRTIDASWLGVPQARERVVLIGFREDEGIDPSDAFPKPAAERTVMRDALPKVARIVRPVRDSGKVSNLHWREEETWPAHRPCATLTKNGLGQSGAGSIYAEEFDGTRRRLTLDELKALSSFPRDFRLPAKIGFGTVWGTMGNSVPPLMAKAWASGIRDALESGS